jgi:hypothetical protein
VIFKWFSFYFGETTILLWSKINIQIIDSSNSGFSIN